MTALADLVNGLAGRPGVAAVVVASPDGLPIRTAGSQLDIEAAAALVVTVARSAARLGDAATIGTVSRFVLECARGMALAGLIRDGNWLLVLAQPEADIGQLLYDLRQEGPALAAQL